MLDRLLKLSISILFFICYRCFILVLSFQKKQLPGTLVILTYHSVKYEQDYKFKKQMDILLKKAYPVFADIKKPLHASKHHAAVTFDDGFQSVIKNAILQMHERKIAATIFIPTGYLGKRPGWISNPKKENANEFLMTDDQLKNLQNDLVKIGSHCVTHPHLTSLEETEARRELVESKKTLEGILNRDINLLSFPYGAYNQQVIEWCREAGYRRVFSNIPTFSTSKIDSFLIGRIDVSPDDWFIEYRLKLLGAYQWLPLAVALKRKLKIMIYPA